MHVSACVLVTLLLLPACTKIAPPPVAGTEPTVSLATATTSSTAGATKYAVASTALTVALDRHALAGNNGVLVGTLGFGSLFDGPIHPWRDHWGTTWINMPHLQNYRIRVADWNDSSKWKMQTTAIFDSERSYSAGGSSWYHLAGQCGLAGLTEPNYGNNMWLQGFWADGASVVSIAHHEWYTTCLASYPNRNATDNRGWISSIHHLKSTDGGASFLPKAYVPYVQDYTSHSDRLVLVPEPAQIAGTDFGMYGFAGPSNIVKEKDYYYAFAAYRGHQPTKGDLNVTGVVIYRTKDIATAAGWEILSEGGWTGFANYYAGNRGIQPRILFRSEHNGYNQEGPGDTSLLGQSIHYHRTSKQWLLFGREGRVYGGPIVFTASPTLADPQFDAGASYSIPGTNDIWPYVSVIDHDSPGQNFSDIGEEAYLYFIRHDLNASYQAPSAGEETYGRYLRRMKIWIGITAGSRSVPDGLFRIGDAVYFQKNGKYCYFASPTSYSSITTRKGFEGIPGYLSPGTAIYTGACTTASFSPATDLLVPAGLFKTDKALYYSNGARYCQFTTPSQFMTRTGLADTNGMRALTKPPIAQASDGYCQ